MVPDLWFWIAPLVDRLVKRAHGELTADGLKSRAVSGDILLWVVSPSDPQRPPLAILTTRLEDWSGSVVARVYGAAGSLAAIRAVAAEGEARLRQMGATRVVFEGRLGWQRTLRDYRPIKILMQKSL